VCCRPIDLLTVKKNIELGVTRTTAEFQRDVMLMFVNSIMYNKSSHFVHKMAQQMQQEGLQHVQVSQHYSHNFINLAKWLDNFLGCLKKCVSCSPNCYRITDVSETGSALSGV
jgi:hypothetical protein